MAFKLEGALGSGDALMLEFASRYFWWALVVCLGSVAAYVSLRSGPQMHSAGAGSSGGQIVSLLVAVGGAIVVVLGVFDRVVTAATKLRDSLFKLFGKKPPEVLPPPVQHEPRRREPAYIRDSRREREDRINRNLPPPGRYRPGTEVVTLEVDPDDDNYEFADRVLLTGYDERGVEIWKRIKTTRRLRS
jgi:hypothetical protein